MNAPIASLDVTYVVSLAVGVLIGLKGASMLPRIWRGQVTYPIENPPWWIWGQPLWRGFVRSTPTASIASGVACAAAAISYIGERIGIAHMAALWINVLALGVLVTGVLLMASVCFFNRPSLLVAPNSRSEPGAVSVWLADAKRTPVDDRSMDLAHAPVPIRQMADWLAEHRFELLTIDSQGPFNQHAIFGRDDLRLEITADRDDWTVGLAEVGMKDFYGTVVWRSWVTGNAISDDRADAGSVVRFVCGEWLAAAAALPVLEVFENELRAISADWTHRQLGFAEDWQLPDPEQNPYLI